MSRIFGAALLVAGTTIGAGMLAVPVMTGEGGFIPSVILYLISFVFSLGTSFCLLESINWVSCKDQVNMGTLMRMTFGYSGQIILSVVYIIFFISLLTAYLCEGGSFFVSLLNLTCSVSQTGITISGILIFFILFAPFVLFGTKPVDFLNRFLMTGLIISFLVFCVNGFFRINLDFLLRVSWLKSFKAFPILFLSFGFHNIVPSLYYYLKRNIVHTRLAIILGTAIPLFFYLLWQTLILGVLPLEILQTTRDNGHTVVFALRKFLDCPLFQWAGDLFGFFALTSSFVGVALGLFDFLLDLFRKSKWANNYFIVTLLTFIAPLLLSVINPDMVLDCLFYGGGIGAICLIGAFPVMILWKGRYHYKYKGIKIIPGGKLTLVFLSLLICIDLFFLLY